jgi:hypothetical protein
MKNKFVFFILFLLFSAVIAPRADAGDKSAKDKRPKVYKSDLDADTKLEEIDVESAGELSKETKITLFKKDRSVIGSFNVPGIFNRLEIVDLSEDGYKQVAVFCVGEGAYTNLAIYALKNGKLSKVFAAGSSCGIETTFRPALSRIKIGRETKTADSVSYTDIPEWDIWVWSGERFIKG